MESKKGIICALCFPSSTISFVMLSFIPLDNIAANTRLIRARMNLWVYNRTASLVTKTRSAKSWLIVKSIVWNKGGGFVINNNGNIISSKLVFTKQTWTRPCSSNQMLGNTGSEQPATDMPVIDHDTSHHVSILGSRFCCSIYINLLIFSLGIRRQWWDLPQWPSAFYK